MTQPFGIVGAGALGQIFAASLAAAGHRVTLLATPRSAERLRAAGKIRVRGAVELDVAVAITTDPAELPEGAALVFTPKGHDLPAAIAQVARAAPAPAWVCGVQNGIVKDDLLAEAFGIERVVGAVTICGGARNDDGSVSCTSRGATCFGELPDGSSDRAQWAADAFNAAGLPTEAVTNVRTVLWSKMCNAAGLFAVSCLSRATGNRLGHHPELVRAYMGLIRETAAVAAAQGIPMGDYPGFPIKTYLGMNDEDVVTLFASRVPPPDASVSRTSMLQDLLAGRPLEVDAIYTDLVDRAARVGVPAPRLTLARDLLQAIDPGRYPQGD